MASATHIHLFQLQSQGASLKVSTPLTRPALIVRPEYLNIDHCP